MPILIGWLLSVAGQFALKALIGVGIALTTFSLVVQPVEAQIAARFSSAGFLADYIGWLGVDKAVTIIMSALIARAMVSSVTAHVTKRAG